MMFILSREQWHRAKILENNVSCPFISYCDLEIRIQFFIVLVHREKCVLTAPSNDASLISPYFHIYDTYD